MGGGGRRDRCPWRVDSDQLARFTAEAQITSQLEHPSIVPVYDLGQTDDGRVYLVMKKIEGRTLADVLRARAGNDPDTSAPWTRARLLRALVQVCNALAYAHERGVVHRDVKPSNIMLGRFGEVREEPLANQAPGAPCPAHAPR